MKSLAELSLIIILSAVASQALAEDATPQPLTRADCQPASSWSWSEKANVCEPSQQAATAAPQPLTRTDCDQAGMSWNESDLVCDDVAAIADRTAAPSSQILITIDKATQKMTVLVGGVEKYDWPVSTGKRGYSTPSGTFTATSMNEIWYSKEWDNAPMPHAIFFMKDGHAIHGSYEVKHLSKPASHGCVRIAPQNATLLYELVKANGLLNTRVVLSGETPGGEGQVASSARSKARSGPSAFLSTRPKNNYYADSYFQPQRRCGLFRRRWCGGP